MRAKSLFFWLVMASTPLVAQVQTGRWTPVVESMDRGYSSISYWTYRDDGVEIGGGRISVEHGTPSWPEALVESAAFDAATIGKLWRLGNNKWTTLDTNLPLVIAGRRIEPGIYYLAIERPRADQWGLAFVEPRTVMPGLIDAWASQARPDEVPVAFSVPLAHATREGGSASELDITLGLEDDAMDQGWLRIEWGPHRLRTSFEIAMVSPTFYREKKP